MKKLIRFICIAVTSVTMLTGCSLTERDTFETVHHTEVPPKMVFLGDSIAAGYGLEGYTSEDNYNCPSYSNLLKEKYKDEKNEMVNKAVSGDTSLDLLELLDSGELDTSLKNSDAVVISIGGNDMLHIIFEGLEKIGYSPESNSINTDDIDLIGAGMAIMTLDGEIDSAIEQFGTNLKDITYAVKNRTQGTVYIQTLYNPFEYFSQIPVIADFTDEKLEKFNNIIKDNTSFGYTVIDVASEFKGKNSVLTNIKDFDIHPNAQGHKVIADTVDRSFSETGFTYVTYEQGEEHLTAYGKGIVSGSISALIILIFITVLKVRKKGEH